MNVAGTRTFVAPPVGEVDVVGGAGLEPEDVVRGPVTVVVLAGARAVEVVALVAGAEVVGAGVVVLAADALVAVELLDECVELPHPGTSASAHTVPNRDSARCILGALKRLCAGEDIACARWRRPC